MNKAEGFRLLTRTVSAVGCLLFLGALDTRAQTTDPAALEVQRKALEEKAGAIGTQMQNLRKEVEQQAPLVELGKKANEAAHAYDQSINQDEAVQQARKALQDAEAALRSTVRDTASADPAGKALLDESRTLDETIRNTDLNRRFDEMKLKESVRAPIENTDAEARESKAKADAAEKAFREKDKAVAEFTQARTAVESAKQAYEALLQNPEIQAARQKLTEAEKAYDTLARTHDVARQKDEAWAAHKQLMDAKTAANPAGQALTAAIEKARQEIDTGRARQKEIGKEFDTICKRVEQENPAVQPSKTLLDDARKAVTAALEKPALVDLKKAADEAKQALQGGLKSALETNADYTALATQERELKQQIKDLAQQIKALQETQKPADQKTE